MKKSIFPGMNRTLHKLLMGKRVTIGPNHIREGVVIGTSIYGTARVKFGDGSSAFYQVYAWDQLRGIE